MTPADGKRDAETLLELMRRVTGQEPRMWEIVSASGSYHYNYASGREGDAPAAGFAPRKAATTIYLADGVGAHATELARLGPHTNGVGCLYLKDLDHVDFEVLEGIWRRMSYTSLTDGTYGIAPARARGLAQHRDKDAGGGVRRHPAAAATTAAHDHRVGQRLQVPHVHVTPAPPIGCRWSVLGWSGGGTGCER